MADITAKQHKDKEAKRLVPEKEKEKGQNDSKNIEAKRHMIEKAKTKHSLRNIDYIYRKHLTR